MYPFLPGRVNDNFILFVSTDGNKLSINPRMTK